MHDMALPFPHNDNERTEPIVTLSIGASTTIPTQGSDYKTLFNTAEPYIAQKEKAETVTVCCYSQSNE